MLPAMGLASDIISTFCRKPLFGYPVMIGSVIAIGVLSFLVWGHHMFVSGMNPYLGMFFASATLAIAIPSAVKVFNWLATLWRAKITFKTPLLFALGIVSLFITGGLGGIFLANPAVDIQLHDTYFVVAHFHLIMAGAALFGVFAGTYYWFPKMFGRFMNETLGKIHFWLTFVAYYATFFPMHFLGSGGMMRRIYDPTYYDYLKPMQGLNKHISIWAFILGVAQLIFIFNFFWSMFKGKKADKNPWKANTLEWQAETPVPEHNWQDKPPEVYRWPYDYSVPGEKEDYIPQTVPPSSK
jgi:cytochrome c oxidase subunit 1